MFIEKLNTWCNHNGKNLIRNNWNVSTLFPFDLSPSLLLYTPSSSIIFSIEDLIGIISIYTVTSYLKSKLHLDKYFNSVNWWNRISAFQLMSHVLSVWVSKLLINFSATANRMQYSEYWPSTICRCYNSLPEKDSFHIFHCLTPKLLQK